MKFSDFIFIGALIILLLLVLPLSIWGTTKYEIEVYVINQDKELTFFKREVKEDSISIMADEDNGICYIFSNKNRKDSTEILQKVDLKTNMVLVKKENTLEII